jgi:hypothetical protein
LPEKEIFQAKRPFLMEKVTSGKQARGQASAPLASLLLLKKVEAGRQKGQYGTRDSLTKV